jgi:hypothetical protein
MITLYKKIRINHEVQFLTNKILNDKIKKKTQFKEKGPKNYHNQSRLSYQTDSRSMSWQWDTPWKRIKKKIQISIPNQSNVYKWNWKKKSNKKGKKSRVNMG